MFSITLTIWKSALNLTIAFFDIYVEQEPMKDTIVNWNINLTKKINIFLIDDVLQKVKK